MSTGYATFGGTSEDIFPCHFKEWLINCDASSFHGLNVCVGTRVYLCIVQVFHTSVRMYVSVPLWFVVGSYCSVGFLICTFFYNDVFYKHARCLHALCCVWVSNVGVAVVDVLCGMRECSCLRLTTSALRSIFIITGLFQQFISVCSWLTAIILHRITRVLKWSALLNFLGLWQMNERMDDGWINDWNK